MISVSVILVFAAPDFCTFLAVPLGYLVAGLPLLPPVVFASPSALVYRLPLFGRDTLGISTEILDFLKLAKVVSNYLSSSASSCGAASPVQNWSALSLFLPAISYIKVLGMSNMSSAA